MFLANAISFVPIIIGVFLIDAKEPQKEENDKSVFAEVIEGLKYVYKTKVLV
ncbi:hypothetical protein [Caldicellulosiruptor naganoensis]|uniref:Uncharacterized protein n=1 Tax=Caldicellulosiruptor naganoensis TaxID=29324 RepID=A0ABY7BGF7_9FIRM|nr:hypothetical protein [Caldicellulosiruptor naganoensis]WAM31894.1 hypothetical protein OTJ99_000376 [Caldicellulosiruptor naganoensis]